LRHRLPDSASDSPSSPGSPSTRAPQSSKSLARLCSPHCRSAPDCLDHRWSCPLGAEAAGRATGQRSPWQRKSAAQSARTARNRRTRTRMYGGVGVREGNSLATRLGGGNIILCVKINTRIASIEQEWPQLLWQPLGQSQLPWKSRSKQRRPPM